MKPKPQPLSPLRKRLPVGRKAVTICIAAIADEHEAIISCVDTKISTSITSLEPSAGQKMCSIRSWTFLSAGTTCYTESFLDTLRGLLAKSSDNEPETIKRLLEMALLIELPKFSAAKYLAPYGIDMSTFLQFRSKEAGFSDERWNELSRSILEYSDQYDIEILVSGWGDIQENHVVEENSRAIAHIFSVSRGGVVPHSHDDSIPPEAANGLRTLFFHFSIMNLMQQSRVRFIMLRLQSLWPSGQKVSVTQL